MYKKIIVAVICLIIALLTLKKENRSFGEAEAMLISKMAESDIAVEVFSMGDEGILT